MLEIVLIVVILAADQLVKLWSEATLTPLGASIPLIPGVFQLTSAHNTGAAWGMMPGGKWLFLALTFVVCIVMAYILIRGRRKMTVFARVILSLLLAGALGNAIDRVWLSYVRDMFDFCLINFPIFNVADSALSVGCCLLVIDSFFMKDRALLNLKLSDVWPPVRPAQESDA